MTITLTPETLQAITEGGLDTPANRHLLEGLAVSWMQIRGLDFGNLNPSLHWPASRQATPSFSHPSFNAVEHRQPLNAYLQTQIALARPLVCRRKSRPESHHELGESGA